MRDDVREAIESARTSDHFEPMSIDPPRIRRHSAERIRHVMLCVLRELPDDMTVAELRDELEPAVARL
jgi:hypothetical protein